MYVIPPKVPEDKASEDVKFELTVDFKCDENQVEGHLVTYTFTVVNSASVISLVSSAIVVAASSFLVL
ncbi:hypothetical protein DSO57_1035093 [Entomophthora muscae]|uniref:Uncharacterized protein n=1 Tax=Entomophthora muscae TaxID=34485 RepID=A0ACC2S225_9FUNG|nr:hypothetical protein DSO57_1035093 [Entomophthora muscae]